MTLTLEIPNELGKQIERAAQERGIDAGAFLIEAARISLDPEATLEALVNEPSPRELAGLPPLTDEQVSRAAFYEDDEGNER